MPPIEIDPNPVTLGTRLFGACLATAADCAIAPFPTIVLLAIEGGVGVFWFGYLVGVILTISCAGPFALPILLLLAAFGVNVRFVHVALGTVVVLPAALMFEGGALLLEPFILSIALGGALGGYVGWSVREWVEGSDGRAWDELLLSNPASHG